MGQQEVRKEEEAAAEQEVLPTSTMRRLKLAVGCWIQMRRPQVKEEASNLYLQTELTNLQLYPSSPEEVSS